MTQATLAYTVVFGWLLIYSVMASIDLGAGVLYLWGQLAGRKSVGRAVIGYMSPVWELTGVFVICFVVSTAAFFPPAAGLLGSALLVPASLATGLMVVRGVAFTLAHYSDQPRAWMNWSFGLSSVAIPLVMVPLFTFLEVGSASLTHPFTLVLMAQALAYLLALSSTTLAFYAPLHGGRAAGATFAAIAQWANALALAGQGLLLWAVMTYVPMHYTAVIRWWPGLALGALFSLAAARLVQRRRGAAALSAVLSLAVPFVTFGWSRLPYLAYPSLRADSIVTSSTMFTYLAAALAVGVLLTAPAAGWLLWSALRSPTEAGAR